MGEALDRGLLKSLVRMLSSLGMYGEAFQPPFLEQTQVHYQAEGQEYMQVGGGLASGISTVGAACGPLLVACGCLPVKCGLAEMLRSHSCSLISLQQQSHTSAAAVASP
jgi:hypothetical protein